MLTQDRYNMYEIQELSGQRQSAIYTKAVKAKKEHRIKAKGSKIILMHRDWVETYLQYIKARDRLQG